MDTNNERQVARPSGGQRCGAACPCSLLCGGHNPLGMLQVYRAASRADLYRSVLVNHWVPVGTAYFKRCLLAKFWAQKRHEKVCAWEREVELVVGEFDGEFSPLWLLDAVGERVGVAWVCQDGEGVGFKPWVDEKSNCSKSSKASGYPVFSPRSSNSWLEKLVLHRKLGNGVARVFSVSWICGTMLTFPRPCCGERFDSHIHKSQSTSGIGGISIVSGSRRGWR